MKKYIIENYEKMTYKEMSDELGLEKYLVYKECYNLEQLGLIDRNKINTYRKVFFNPKKEQILIDMYLDHTYLEISTKLGISGSLLGSHIAFLKKCNILSRHKERGRYGKERPENKVEIIKHIKKIDKHYNDEAKNNISENLKIRKGNLKKVGDSIKVKVYATDQNLILDAVVVGVYDRFYLCKTKLGWNSCEMKIE